MGGGGGVMGPVNAGAEAGGRVEGGAAGRRELGQHEVNEDERRKHLVKEWSKSGQIVVKE